MNENENEKEITFEKYEALLNELEDTKAAVEKAQKKADEYYQWYSRELDKRMALEEQIRAHITLLKPLVG